MLRSLVSSLSMICPWLAKWWQWLVTELSSTAPVVLVMAWTPCTTLILRSGISEVSLNCVNRWKHGEMLQHSKNRTKSFPTTVCGGLSFGDYPTGTQHECLWLIVCIVSSKGWFIITVAVFYASMLKLLMWLILNNLPFLTHGCHMTHTYLRSFVNLMQEKLNKSTASNGC
jgi:hypothetical protein